MHIRRLTVEDVTPAYVGWLNDPEINRFLECRWRTHTIQSEKLALSGDKHIFGAFLEAHVGERHIGNVNYVPHHFQPVASLGVIIDKKYWGKGHGTQAIKLLSDRLFDGGYEKLWATLYAENVGSKRVFEKAGFQQEGIFRKHYRLNQDMADMVIMGKCRAD